MWLQIPFLCGQSAFCWYRSYFLTKCAIFKINIDTFCYYVIHRIPGNEWALQEAKRNLIKEYLLVGVTDQISSFISVLETVLPQFFTGATEHFSSSTYLL